MIKRSLSLVLSTLLALAPSVSAQVAPQASGGGRSTFVTPTNGNGATPGNVPALPVSAAVIPGALTIASAPLLASQAEAFAANASAPNPLMADSTPAAVFVRAALADPSLLTDASVRAEAVRVLGADAVVRVQAAAAILAGKTDRVSSAARAALRAEGGFVRARSALTQVAAEFATLGSRTAEELSPVSAVAETPASIVRLAKPSRAWNAVRRAAIAIAMTAGLLVGTPAVQAQNAPAPQAQTQVQTQGEYATASDINGVLAQWTAGTKLYVIGDVGLDTAALNALARSLQGKHWTVILVKDAAGMKYVDAQGQTHYNEDAVEYAANQGVRNKSGFAALVNPVTGEKDGAVYTLVLAQKAQYLRTSEAHNTRGLNGETEFASRDLNNPDKLDRYTIPHLRKGETAEAVQSIVAGLDGQLNQAISSEQTSAKSTIASAKTAIDQLVAAQAELRRTHPSAASRVGVEDAAALRSSVAAAETALSSKQSAKAKSISSAALAKAQAALNAIKAYEASAATAVEALGNARAQIDALESASSAYRSAHPKAAGDLARPNLAGLRASLKSADAARELDPAKARATADSVLAEAKRLNESLAQHPAGAQLLADAQKRLDDLKARERADAAAPDIVAAQQALGEAREAHENGSSSWTAKLQSAKSALGNAERAVADADASARTKSIVFFTLLGLFTLLTLGAAIWLNRRAARSMVKAEDLYKGWVEGLNRKLDAMLDELDKKMDVYIGPDSGPKARGWVGSTKKLAELSRDQSGSATILLGSARRVLAQADALIHPKTFTPGWFANLFWPSRYEAAIRKLKDEPVEFKFLEGEDNLRSIFGENKSWREDLYGKLETYKPFKKSFNELIAAFNASAAAALEAVEKIEKAATGHGPALNKVESKIASLSSKRADIESGAAKSGLFSVPALYGTALENMSAKLAEARKTVQTDPVGGLDGAGATSEAMADSALALATELLALHSTKLAGFAAVTASLAAEKIETSWIADDLKALSEQAEAAAATIATGKPGEVAAKFSSSVNEDLAFVQAAAETAAEIAKTRADIAAAAGTVSAARAEIGDVLGLEAGKTLREKDADPTAVLAAASETVETAARLLGEGKAEAGKVRADAARLHQESLAIVAESLRSLKEHDGVLEGRRTEAARLDALVPERQTVLESIKRDFAASTLALNAGDASHPNANGTVADNADEAEAAIASAKKNAKDAVVARRAGKLLEAASLLSSAQASEEIAQHRLDEIADKRARLDAAVADNEVKLSALETKSRGWKAEIPGDKRTMKPTMAAYEASVAELEAARGLADAKKGDPFRTATAIAAASAEMDQLWVKVANDRDAFAEVERSLKAADSQLAAASRQADAARSDQTSDSEIIKSSYTELDSLQHAYRKALQASGVEHGDWPKIDKEADRITSEAARLAATLKGEIAAAAKAVDAISSAANKVREATNWTGSYGVSVPGSPGSGSLSSARDALSRGDYASAISHAESARRSAISAIETAEAEVSRRRREEEERRRREEEDRRRRQREEDDRRNRSSGGGSGGGGSSWGGSSSGGGKSSW